MNEGLKLALAVACGVALGFGAGAVGKSPPADRELAAQISELTRRLEALDTRLASQSESAALPLDAQVLDAVRTALAERDVAAGAASASARHATAPASRSEWTSEDRAELRGLIEAGADPEDVLPLIREAVRDVDN